MSILEPNINDIGERTIKCPKCHEIHTFKIFYTNVSLAVGGISLLPFNKKFTALCLGCKSLFEITSEKGNRYLRNREIAIASEDLELRSKENA